jgi:protein transport protein SEC24
MSSRRKYPGAAPTGATGVPANGSSNGLPQSFAPHPSSDPHASHHAPYTSTGSPPPTNTSYATSPPTQELAGTQIDPRSIRGPHAPTHAPHQDPQPWDTNPTPTGTGAPVSLAPYMPEQANLTCPPEFLRLTMGCVPQSQELLNACQIPFGAIIHPLAETSESPVRGTKRTVQIDRADILPNLDDLDSKKVRVTRYGADLRVLGQQTLSFLSCRSQ